MLTAEDYNDIEYALNVAIARTENRMLLCGKYTNEMKQRRSDLKRFKKLLEKVRKM